MNIRSLSIRGGTFERSKYLNKKKKEKIRGKERRKKMETLEMLNSGIANLTKIQVSTSV